MSYRVEIYDGGQHPAVRPCKVVTATTEMEAHRLAARELGHGSLRGASTWDRYQGGTVYQFGPRNENNEHDFAVILSPEELT